VTSKPELDLGGHLLPGLIAVALFVVMAATFAGASLGAPTTGADGPFQTQPKVVTVALDDGESAELVQQNGSTDVVISEGGSTVDRVQVHDTGSVNASIVEGADRAEVTVQADVTITESIGHAMFGFNDPSAASDERVESVQMAAVESEGFLAAFEIIDVVLVAALVGAVVLARREVDGEIVSALRPDGGEEDE